jgi:hypothetical protein
LNVTKNLFIQARYGLGLTEHLKMQILKLHFSSISGDYVLKLKQFDRSIIRAVLLQNIPYENFA